MKRLARNPHTLLSSALLSPHLLLATAAQLGHTNIGRQDRKILQLWCLVTTKTREPQSHVKNDDELAPKWRHDDITLKDYFTRRRLHYDRLEKPNLTTNHFLEILMFCFATVGDIYEIHCIYSEC